MTEEHVMEVRWSGSKVLGEAMAEAARAQGYKPVLEDEGGEATLMVKVVDNDLQTLRDRVDELLVAFSTLEEAHNG